MDALVALGQLLVAAAVAWFTYRLSVFTKQYAADTRRLTELQSQANEIQAAALQQTRSVAEPTPRSEVALTAAQTARKVDDVRAGAPLLVRNIGSAPAFQVQVDTSWGPAKVVTPIGPGADASTEVEIPREQWTKGDDPDIQGFRFVDGSGRHWYQPRGGVPELEPGEEES